MNPYSKSTPRRFYCRFCQRYVTEKLEFIDWRRVYTRRYEQDIYQLVAAICQESPQGNCYNDPDHTSIQYLVIQKLFSHHK